MTENTSNGLGDALLKGLKWGAIIGGILWLIIAILSSSDSSVNLDIWAFITGFLVFGIGGGVLGAISSGIFLGVIGVVTFFLTFISGTLLSLTTIIGTSTIFIGTTTISTVFGWVSVALLPILLIVKSFVSENAPTWLKQSINGSIVAFLTSVIFTGLIYSFEHITGTKLLIPH